MAGDSALLPGGSAVWPRQQVLVSLLPALWLLFVAFSLRSPVLRCNQQGEESAPAAEENGSAPAAAAAAPAAPAVKKPAKRGEPQKEEDLTAEWDTAIDQHKNCATLSGRVVRTNAAGVNVKIGKLLVRQSLQPLKRLSPPVLPLLALRPGLQVSPAGGRARWSWLHWTGLAF